MRRIVVASKEYLERRGEPKTPAAIASHDTIQFGAATAAPDWRFVEDGRGFVWATNPRFDQQRRRCDPVCGSGRRTSGPVLAYQAAKIAQAQRLKIVLAPFEQPAMPIHIVYPTAAVVGQGAHLHRSGDRDHRLEFG
jgi:hypothetical protein